MQILQIIVTCIAIVAAALTDKKKNPKIFLGFLLLTISLVVIAGIQSINKDKEIETINSMTNVRAIADKVISNYDAFALDELVKLEKESPDSSIKIAVTSELSRIVAQWPTMSEKLERQILDKTNISCKGGKTNYNCPNSELIEHLLENEKWPKRFRALLELKQNINREEMEVLVSVIKKDRNIVVRYQACHRLSRLIRPRFGVTHRDLIFCDSTLEHLKNKKEEILEGLNK